MGKVTPESVIAFAKLSLIVSFSWPLPTTATRSQVIRFKLLRFLSFVNVWLLFVPLLMVFQDCSSHPDICLKSIPIVVGGVLVLIQMSLYHGQYRNLQLLIAEMENQCKRAKGYEKDILQRYVNRCATFYAVITMWFYLTALAVICSPPLLADTFPTHAKYPFDVERQPLKTIIYVHQSYAGIQMASHLSTNVLIALLLWFAGARFDILSNELRMVSNIYELAQCIRKHQQVIRYANDVTHAVRFMILAIVGCKTMALLFSGLIFVSRQLLIVKVQFLLLSFTSLFEVFMCCWPANNLLFASLDAGQAIYESLWYFRDIHLQKNVHLILLRCQKPVVVTIACIIPILSLKYFYSFVSTAFSYFMALRIIFGNSADEV